MKVVLPWPHKDLSPNARVPWRRRADLARQAKEHAHWTTREQLGPSLKQAADRMQRPLCLTVTFLAPNARRCDRDNLLASCKSAIDGMCAALGIDDAEFAAVTACTGEPTAGGAVLMEIGCLDAALIARFGG